MARRLRFYEKWDRLVVASAKPVRHPKRNSGRNRGDREYFVEQSVLVEPVSRGPTRGPSGRNPWLNQGSKKGRSAVVRWRVAGHRKHSREGSG